MIIQQHLEAMHELDRALVSVWMRDEDETLRKRWEKVHEVREKLVSHADGTSKYGAVDLSSMELRDYFHLCGATRPSRYCEALRKSMIIVLVIGRGLGVDEWDSRPEIDQLESRKTAWTMGELAYLLEDECERISAVIANLAKSSEASDS